jgi:hypothetical protein
MGRWPIEGWLSAFHERGLISRAADGRPEVAWWGGSAQRRRITARARAVGGIDFRRSG